MSRAEEVSLEDESLLLRAYLAFNAQDLDGLLALVAEDVDWPDDDGGRLHGKEALSAYWSEQWTRVRAHDHPVAFEQRGDGRVAVRVRQAVRALDGTTISTGELTHLHRIDGARIAGMDVQGVRASIEEPAQAADEPAPDGR